MRVRRALSLAIDRDVIVDQVLKGGQWAAYHFTHFKTAGFTAPGIDYAGMSQSGRDAEAKRLFAESGSGTCVSGSSTTPPRATGRSPPW